MDVNDAPADQITQPSSDDALVPSELDPSGSSNSNSADPGPKPVGGLTPEEELRLLKAHIRRIARQCTTEFTSGSYICGGRGERVEPVTEEMYLLEGAVNNMLSQTTQFVRSTAHIARAVSNGDLTARIDADLEGEMGEAKFWINHMVGCIADPQWQAGIANFGRGSGGGTEIGTPARVARRN